jgi:hypothetical protein
MDAARRILRHLWMITAIDTAAMQVEAIIPVSEVPKRINTLVMN